MDLSYAKVRGRILEKENFPIPYTSIFFHRHP